MLRRVDWEKGLECLGGWRRFVDGARVQVNSRGKVDLFVVFKMERQAALSVKHRKFLASKHSESREFFERFNIKNSICGF